MADRRLAWWKRAGNAPFVVLIRLYRVTLSPFLGGQCRYEPTCSVYALDAYRLYGPIRATRMTIGRILRCHPFVKGGYDPVPIPDDPADLNAGRPVPHASRKGHREDESTPSRPTP